MNVVLRGSSPATMTAGILLMSRARSFGQRMRVAIVGDPTDIGVVYGPAILHSAPLASCGVGREFGSGSVVVVPGPAMEPLAVSLSADGRSDWFYVDRTGEGVHPATRDFVRLVRSPGGEAQALGQSMLDALEALGCAPEPAILDLLFGAPAPPLVRLALALRAGRALSGQRGLPINQFLGAEEWSDDEGGLALDVSAAIARLAPAAQDPVSRFLGGAAHLPEAEGGPAVALVRSLGEILVYVAMLPRQGILPPLDPAMDAVAFTLGRALTAINGNPQGQSPLYETYRFLGGTFTPQAEYPIELPADLPPQDRLQRWQWFCSHVSAAATSVDRIWRDLMDPPM